MPHVILEHNLTNKEQVTKLSKLLHEELCKQDTVKPETVKSRSIFVNDALFGADARPFPFLHAEVKLLPGRPQALKTKISESLMQVLKSIAPEESILSVELRELDSYSKCP